MSVLRNGIPWAGLAAGPTAWAISTQANYALAGAACAHGSILVLALAAVLVAMALGGAGLSWLAWRARMVEASGPLESTGRPRYWLACVSTFLALLLALVVIMQGAAGLVLTGCER